MMNETSAKERRSGSEMRHQKTSHASPVTTPSVTAQNASVSAAAPTAPQYQSGLLNHHNLTISTGSTFPYLDGMFHQSQSEPLTHHSGPGPPLAPGVSMPFWPPTPSPEGFGRYNSPSLKGSKYFSFYYPSVAGSFSPHQSYPSRYAGLLQPSALLKAVPKYETLHQSPDFATASTVSPGILSNTCSAVHSNLMSPITSISNCSNDCCTTPNRTTNSRKHNSLKECGVEDSAQSKQKKMSSQRLSEHSSRARKDEKRTIAVPPVQHLPCSLDNQMSPPYTDSSQKKKVSKASTSAFTSITALATSAKPSIDSFNYPCSPASYYNNGGIMCQDSKSIPRCDLYNKPLTVHVPEPSNRGRPPSKLSISSPNFATPSNGYNATKADKRVGDSGKSESIRHGKNKNGVKCSVASSSQSETLSAASSSSSIPVGIAVARQRHKSSSKKMDKKYSTFSNGTAHKSSDKFSSGFPHDPCSWEHKVRQHNTSINPEMSPSISGGPSFLHEPRDWASHLKAISPRMSTPWMPTHQEIVQNQSVRHGNQFHNASPYGHAPVPIPFTSLNGSFDAGHMPIPPVGYQLSRDPLTGHVFLIPASDIDIIGRSHMWPMFDNSPGSSAAHYMANAHHYQHLIDGQHAAQLQHLSQLQASKSCFPHLQMDMYQHSPEIPRSSRTHSHHSEKLSDKYADESPLTRHNSKKKQPVEVNDKSFAVISSSSPQISNNDLKIKPELQPSPIEPAAILKSSSEELEEEKQAVVALTDEKSTIILDVEDPDLDSSRELKIDEDFTDSQDESINIESPDDKCDLDFQNDSLEVLNKIIADVEELVSKDDVIENEERPYILDPSDPVESPKAITTCDEPPVLQAVDCAVPELQPISPKPVDFIDNRGLNLLLNSIEEFNNKEMPKLEPQTSEPPRTIATDDELSIPHLSSPEQACVDMPSPKIDSINTGGLSLLCALAEKHFKQEIEGDVNQHSSHGSKSPKDVIDDIAYDIPVAKFEYSHPLHTSNVNKYECESLHNTADVMDPIEIEMRSRMAELQRKYKEKQRELAKLQPKIGKRSRQKFMQRKPGRPQRRSLTLPKRSYKANIKRSPNVELSTLSSTSPAARNSSLELKIKKKKTIDFKQKVSIFKMDNEMDIKDSAVNEDIFSNLSFEFSDDHSDPNPSICNKRKPGRPRKHSPQKSESATETIVAKKFKSMSPQKSPMQTNIKKEVDVLNKNCMEDKTPIYDENAWSRRRSERIFLSDVNTSANFESPSINVSQTRIKTEYSTASAESGSEMACENPLKRKSFKGLSKPILKKSKFSFKKLKEKKLDNSNQEMSNADSEECFCEEMKEDPDLKDSKVISDANTKDDATKDEFFDRCTITPDILLDDLRVLILMEGLFYAGRISAIEPPDVYGVILDGERGNRPHIYTQEEILRDSILEKKPESKSALRPGTRVCAFWSQQYRCLYPGTIAKSTSPSLFPNRDLINVEFDDGDSGKIDTFDVRLLPVNYPIVSVDPNPIMTGKRRRRASSGEALASSDNNNAKALVGYTSEVGSGKLASQNNDVVEEVSAKVKVKSKKKSKRKGEGKSRKRDEDRERKHKHKKHKDKCHHRHHHRHKHHHKHHKKHRHNETHSDRGKDGSHLILNEESLTNGNSSDKKKPELTMKIRTNSGDTSLNSHNSSTQSCNDYNESFDGSTVSSQSDCMVSEDSVDQVNDQGAIDKEEKESNMKNCGKIKRKEKVIPENRSKIAAFLPAKQIWRWSGKGFKRPGMKGKAKKEFYKSITRGKETIMVGDSAVFLSTGRPHLPFIGRIEMMWESWGGNMVVKVKWFYHPEETEGGDAIEQLEGALYESPHYDENDVQTISHKCRVLSWATYKSRKDNSSSTSKHRSTHDSNDIYYLAGSYDPTTQVLTIEPNIELKKGNISNNRI